MQALGLLMLCAATARAQEHALPTGDTRERLSVSVSVRAGLVEAPFVSSTFPQVSGFATVLRGSAALRLNSVDRVHLQLPVSIARLDFPARAQVALAALGNLELGFEHAVDARPDTRLSFAAAIIAPTAEHGSTGALLDNRTLALADACVACTVELADA